MVLNCSTVNLKLVCSDFSLKCFCSIWRQFSSMGLNAEDIKSNYRWGQWEIICQAFGEQLQQANAKNSMGSPPHVQGTKVAFEKRGTFVQHWGGTILWTFSATWENYKFFHLQLCGVYLCCTGWYAAVTRSHFWDSQQRHCILAAHILLAVSTFLLNVFVCKQLQQHPKQHFKYILGKWNLFSLVVWSSTGIKLKNGISFELVCSPKTSYFNIVSWQKTLFSWWL